MLCMSFLPTCGMIKVACSTQSSHCSELGLVNLCQETANSVCLHLSFASFSEHILACVLTMPMLQQVSTLSWHGILPVGVVPECNQALQSPARQIYSCSLHCCCEVLTPLLCPSAAWLDALADGCPHHLLRQSMTSMGQRPVQVPPSTPVRLGEASKLGRVEVLLIVAICKQFWLTPWVPLFVSADATQPHPAEVCLSHTGRHDFQMPTLQDGGTPPSSLSVAHSICVHDTLPPILPPKLRF